MRLRESPRHSHSREVGRYRFGEFVYVGLLPVAEASAYMRERMPLHSWQLVERDADEDGGSETMSFRRGPYVAECVLTRTEDRSTVMKIDVRTRPQQQ